MTSLFDTPSEGDKKRSIFDSEWTNAESGNDTEIHVRLTPLAPLILVGGFLTLFQLVWSHFILTLLSGLVILLSGIALWQIARSEKTLSGKGLVYSGLFLTLVSIISVQVSEFVYNNYLISQGRIFAQLVMDAAKKGDTTTLERLQHPYQSRAKVTNEVAYWQSIMEQFKENHSSIHEVLLDQPTLRTLYALGDQAKIRFYKSLPVESHKNEHMLPLVYSVTYNNAEGKPETFFCLLILNHIKSDKGLGEWKWSLVSKKALDLEEM